MSRQFVIVAELDRCIGCRGCEVACKWENDVPLGVSRCRSYTMGPTGTFPKLNMYFLPLMCQQCENPACADACPMGLEPFLLNRLWKNNEVEEIEKRSVQDCIECGCCLYSCPANIPLLDNIRLAKAQTLGAIRARAAAAKAAAEAAKQTK